jgi:hypothetical protein
MRRLSTAARASGSCVCVDNAMRGPRGEAARSAATTELVAVTLRVADDRVFAPDRQSRAIAHARGRT